MFSDQGQTSPLLYRDQKSKKYVCVVTPPAVKYLVISGGGAKGVILPGVIKALEEQRPRTDSSKTYLDTMEVIIGSSIGAVTAALTAASVSAEKVMQVTSNIKFKGLLGSKWKLIRKDAAPLKDFIRTNMWDGIISQLISLHRDSNIDSIARKYSSNIDLQSLFNEWKAKGNQGKISFEMLRALHQQWPDKFKELVVTATVESTGETYYLSADNTPRLDVVDACRASAALPILIESVEISIEDLKGGRYEMEGLLPNVVSIRLVDGGLFDNIPVASLKLAGLKNISNLEVLALVFDELKQVLGQSPLLNERNPNNALYNPSKLDKFVRDVAPKLFHGMKTDRRNTEQKAQGLEQIREQFAHRHIPLKIDITTTDFDLAEKNASKYHKAGYEIATDYLRNHQNEILYYAEDSLSELLDSLPDFLKEDKQIIQKITELGLLDPAAISQSTNNSSGVLLNQVNKILNQLNQTSATQNKTIKFHYEQLKVDLLDNLKNQLSDKEKKMNMVKILLIHYYQAAQDKVTDFSVKLRNIISSEFNHDLTQLNVNLTTLPDREEKLINLMKLANVKIDYKIFLNNVYSIVSQTSFWEGKAESRTGLNATKIPDGVSEILKIYNDNLSDEEKFFKIQIVADQKLEQNQSLGLFDMKKSEETLTFYRAIATYPATNGDSIKKFLSVYSSEFHAPAQRPDSNL